MISDLWVKMKRGLWLRVGAEGLAGCFDCVVGSERLRVGDRNQDTVLKTKILFRA
jgi:hypothetical protein